MFSAVFEDRCTIHVRVQLNIISTAEQYSCTDQAGQVREALDLINTAQQAATIESREGAKKLALQQQVCNSSHSTIGIL